MSVAFLRWVKQIRDIRPLDRAVVQLLADRVAADGTWQFGMRELAEEMGVARNTLRAALDRLAGKSLLAFKVEAYRGEAQAAHRFKLIRNEQDRHDAEAEGFTFERRELERVWSKASWSGSKTDPDEGGHAGQGLTGGGSRGCPTVGQLFDPLSNPQNSPSKLTPSGKPSGDAPAETKSNDGETASRGRSASIEKAPFAAAGTTGRPRKVEPKLARRASTTWPSGFALDDAGQRYAEERGYGGDRATSLFEAFETHNRAKASAFADWSMAWRNWVTKQVVLDARNNGTSRSTSRDGPVQNRSTRGVQSALAGIESFFGNERQE